MKILAAPKTLQLDQENSALSYNILTTKTKNNLQRGENVWMDKKSSS